MKPWPRPAMTVALGLLLAVFSTSCTHNPVTGERIAETFEGCMAANVGIGAVGGTLVGILTGVIAGEITEDKKTARKAGQAAGVAVFLATVVKAWQLCAQEYQKVSNAEVRSREEVRPDVGPGPALRVDDLTMTAGAPGEDLNSVVRYTVLADDPARKDIPVRETRIVLVPRVVKDEQDRIFYADAGDKLLLDASGRPIPADGSVRIDPKDLVYDQLAFPVDNVVKQGQRKADGLLPTPREMPDGIPYRFRFVVEAEGQRAEKEVEFRFARPGQGAATFTATGQPPSSPSAPAKSHRERISPERTADAQQPVSGGWSGAAKRSTALREAPGGKAIGQLPQGTLLAVVDAPPAGAKGLKKSSGWVKVRTETGAVGWLRKSEIKGMK